MVSQGVASVSRSRTRKDPKVTKNTVCHSHTESQGWNPQESLVCRGPLFSFLLWIFGPDCQEHTGEYCEHIELRSPCRHEVCQMGLVSTSCRCRSIKQVTVTVYFESPHLPTCDSEGEQDEEGA